MVDSIENSKLSNKPSHDIAVWFAEFAQPEDCYRAFEAYGHAMATASTFEQLMALMVIEAYALRLDKRAGNKIAVDDQPNFLRSLLKGSDDTLRRKLVNSFTLSAEVQLSLVESKDFRDHLAHNFWQRHAGNLLSADGVDVIATECAHVANHFRLLANALLAETGVDVRDYITSTVLVDADIKLRGWQKKLKELGLT